MAGKLMSYDCKIIQAQNGATAGQTAVTSSAVDCYGYDGALIIASLATVSAGSVLGLQAQDATTSGGTYGNIGTAAAYTDVAGESSNTLLVTDVVNFQKRYLKAVLTRTTANAVVNNIVVILYRGKFLPISWDASVIAHAAANATA